MRAANQWISKSIEFDNERFMVIGRLHFLIRSKSHPDEVHCVDLERVNENWSEGGCTCRGFETRKECRHVRVIRAWLDTLT